MKHQTWIALALGALIASAGCGKKKDETKAEPGQVSDAGGAGAPALALPALGIDSPRRLNYVYGAGAKDYERARAA
jgi:hypothetical protein